MYSLNAFYFFQRPNMILFPYIETINKITNITWPGLAYDFHLRNIFDWKWWNQIAIIDNKQIEWAKRTGWESGRTSVFSRFKWDIIFIDRIRWAGDCCLFERITMARQVSPRAVRHFPYAFYIVSIILRIPWDHSNQLYAFMVLIHFANAIWAPCISLIRLIHFYCFDAKWTHKNRNYVNKQREMTRSGALCEQSH